VAVEDRWRIAMRGAAASPASISASCAEPGRERPAGDRRVGRQQPDGRAAAADQHRAGPQLREMDVKEVAARGALDLDPAAAQPGEAAAGQRGQRPDLVGVEARGGAVRDQPPGGAHRPPGRGRQRREAELVEEPVDERREPRRRVRPEERGACRHQQREEPPAALVGKAFGQRDRVGERRFEPFGVDRGRGLSAEKERHAARRDDLRGQGGEQHAPPPAMAQRQRGRDHLAPERPAVELGAKPRRFGRGPRLVEGDRRDPLGQGRDHAGGQRLAARRMQRNHDGARARPGLRSHGSSPALRNGEGRREAGPHQDQASEMKRDGSAMTSS